MKLKLECTLRLNTGEHPIDLAQDVNIVELPDSMDDEAVTAFFNRLREGMKTKYMQHLISLLEVDIREVKE